jgi:tRNA U34 5-methylaminomethyl-2-thiouridine-forming methyltransferase MnmC
MQQRLIITSDGTHTVYVPELNENYHSVHGAMQESIHIFINAGLRSLDQNEISVFEAGFGTGLNALLTASYAEENMLKINYVTIEKFPLNDETISQLNYGSKLGDQALALFNAIHSSPWNIEVQVTGNFSRKKSWLTLLPGNRKEAST